MKNMNRRSMLAGLSGSVLLALSGCTGVLSREGNNPSADQNKTTTRGQDASTTTATTTESTTPHQETTTSSGTSGAGPENIYLENTVDVERRLALTVSGPNGVEFKESVTIPAGEAKSFEDAIPEVSHESEYEFRVEIGEQMLSDSITLRPSVAVVEVEVNSNNIQLHYIAA